jgi:hypothetical protein
MRELKITNETKNQTPLKFLYHLVTNSATTILLRQPVIDSTLFLISQASWILQSLLRMKYRDGLSVALRRVRLTHLRHGLAALNLMDLEETHLLKRGVHDCCDK